MNFLRFIVRANLSTVDFNAINQTFQTERNDTVFSAVIIEAVSMVTPGTFIKHLILCLFWELSVLYLRINRTTKSAHIKFTKKNKTAHIFWVFANENIIRILFYSQVSYFLLQLLYVAIEQYNLSNAEFF